MRNGIIVPAILSGWNNFEAKWRTSFIASIGSKFGGFFSRSLTNSVIVSSITDYRTKIYSESLINKLIKSFMELWRKILNSINKLFNKSIKQSAVFNISNYIINTIRESLFQFLCIALGTGILTYTVLSFITGRLGIIRMTVFLFASIILAFLGVIKIDVKALLSESKFATILRNFFDYYS